MIVLCCTFQKEGERMSENLEVKNGTELKNETMTGQDWNQFFDLHHWLAFFKNYDYQSRSIAYLKFWTMYYSGQLPSQLQKEIDKIEVTAQFLFQNLNLSEEF